MKKGKILKVHDRVALVAPSRAGNKQLISKSRKFIEQLGLDPVIYPSCNEELNCKPDQRAQDINQAFEDEEIKGVFCLRAGMGAVEVLEYLDHRIIEQNPKPFIGFSDITAIHLFLNRICRMGSFYGPLASSNVFMKKNKHYIFDEYSYESIRKMLFYTDTKVLVNPIEDEMKVIYQGKMKGRIVGGNLSILYKTLNSGVEIKTQNSILFIEDMGESLDNIYIMLEKLKHTGKFKECSGIILGNWERCAEEHGTNAEYAIFEFFKSYFTKLEKPTLFNICCGHKPKMMTLPLGTECLVDTKIKQIQIVENILQ